MGISTLPVTRSTTKVWKVWSNGPNYNSLTGNRTGEYIGYPYTRVYYLGGYYIFGTSNAAIAYSLDAKTWNYQIIFPTGVPINAIAFNGTTWVVVGQNNYCYTSTSLGGTWTARTSTIGGTQRINDVVWVGGSINLFILVGQNNGAGSTVIASSSNGTTWTSRYTTTSENFYNIAVNTAQSTIMTTMDSGIANNQGRYSTNGTTWSIVNVTNSATPMYASGDYLPHVDRFVVYYFQYRRAAADLGTRWEAQPGSETQTLPSYWMGNTATSTNLGAVSKRKPIWDSANSVYYVLDPGSGRQAPACLITYGNQDILWQYTTSVANAADYTWQTVSTEYIDTQSKGFNTSGNISESNVPALGYGNGIWVAAYSNYNGYNPVIYSTAV